jgi:hypothetical protein
MAFKLKPPYDTVIPNVYFRDMEDGELGRAEKNGTIILNEEMKDPSQIDEVIGHEKIHLEQIRRGDLDYDDKYVYWKGKRYLRSKMKEGDPKLPWEAEVYNKTKQKKPKV